MSKWRASSMAMIMRKRKDYNEYMRKYMLKRYHARRKEAIETLGGKCSACGSRDSLHIDHIDPQTKSFGISKLWSVSYKKYQAELSKCQLLCEDCHKEKSRADGSYGKNRARGERVGTSKLTESDVIQIRELASTTTQSSLAKIFGVSRACIRFVVRRKTWKEVHGSSV